MKNEMRIRARHLLIVAVVFLAGYPLHAQEAEVPRARVAPGRASAAFPYARPEEVGLVSARLERLGDEIARWVAKGELVGAELLVVKDGRTVYHEAYGWSDREERRPMALNSIFSVKSMSKPFTATAILMLAQEGALSLDDPARRYVPAFPNDSVSIRHLLSHTSGYEGLADTGDPRTVPSDGFTTLRDWVSAWAAREPTGHLGRYSYSDFNYMTLGAITEAVSGTPVDSFIVQRILRPLALDDTHTAFSPGVPWASRMNSRYAWDAATGTYARFWTRSDPQPWAFYPAAYGLFTTATDYAKFLAAWLNGGKWHGEELIPSDAVGDALRVHGRGPTSGYGYGWQIEGGPRSGGMPAAFYHTGYDGTLAMAIPAEHALVVFLTQSRGRPILSMFQNRLGLLEVFDSPLSYNDLLTWAGDQELPAVDLPLDALDRHVGTYRGQVLGPNGALETTATVQRVGSRLRYTWGPGSGMTYDLVPLDDGSFALGRYRGETLEEVGPAMRLRFSEDAGQVSGLTLSMGSRPMFRARRMP